ncbi:hypothetical protein [Salinigranum sp.]|uniref:hypothetical protein n=1 Tax=Salinigranum sp. TaxID=1966351 RepID=UPI003565CC4D
MPAPTDAADDEWPWPDSLDALAAAPDSHRVCFENDRVRVVEVVVPPGETEPVHTHRWPSVMLVGRAARVRYYDGDGDVVSESPERPDDESATQSPPRVEWLEPEGPHAVENVDTVPFHATRVELKRR